MEPLEIVFWVLRFAGVSLAVIPNLFIVATIVHSHILKHDPVYTLVAFLAICDSSAWIYKGGRLLYSVSEGWGRPSKSRTGKEDWEEWVYDEVWPDAASHGVQIVAQLLLALHMYVLIVHPYRAMVLFTPRRARWVCFLSWLVYQVALAVAMVWWLAAPEDLTAADRQAEAEFEARFANSTDLRERMVWMRCFSVQPTPLVITYIACCSVLLLTFVFCYGSVWRMSLKMLAPGQVAAGTFTLAWTLLVNVLVSFTFYIVHVIFTSLIHFHRGDPMYVNKVMAVTAWTMYVTALDNIVIFSFRLTIFRRELKRTLRDAIDATKLVCPTPETKRRPPSVPRQHRTSDSPLRDPRAQQSSSEGDGGSTDLSVPDSHQGECSGECSRERSGECSGECSEEHTRDIVSSDIPTGQLEQTSL